MGIFNQLLVRFPKWIVSWVLFTIDVAIGFYVLDRIVIDPSVQFTNYSFFTIFIILQIFWCTVFWATNLYNGDAEVSRFGETETLIKVTFFIMTAGIFMLGIDISLGPVNAQEIIRYWILFTVLTILNRWIIRSVQKFLLKKGFGQHNVIVIGSGERSRFVTEKLFNHRQRLYHVIGCVETNRENDINKNFSNNILGKEIYECSYENLVYNFENEVKKLLDFCKINWDKNVLNYFNNKRRVLTVSSAQIRESVYNSSINSWLNYKKDLEKHFEKLS